MLLAIRKICKCDQGGGKPGPYPTREKQDTSYREGGGHPALAPALVGVATLRLVQGDIACIERKQQPGGWLRARQERTIVAGGA